jgi:hypothetical protein
MYISFFCSLPLSPLQASQVPCGRLIVFSSSPLFFLRWCGGAPRYFPRPPTPTLSSPFSFLDDTIRTQHDIHGWPIRPGFEPCRPRGGGRKSVALPSTPCSGAATFAPQQLLPLLKLLRAGVPDAEDDHIIGQALNQLPGFGWEQFEGPVVAPAARGPQMVGITQQTIDFWTDLVDEELDEREIRWTDGEYRIFQKIVQSMGSKKGFNVAVDL